MTDYERVARSGDYVRRYDGKRYRDVAATLDAFVGDATRVLEVACGTGHWVEYLGCTGVDASRGMLESARARMPNASLVHAMAEALPFAGQSFERVAIINALHHFRDPERAIREARRVLCGGALIVIALDPSSGRDHWSLYDFFDTTRERDLVRYPSRDRIRACMQDAGFTRVETRIAETFHEELPAHIALASGALAKETTSQLSELSDAVYEAGIARLERAAHDAEARGETLMYRTHLELHATIGTL